MNYQREVHVYETDLMGIVHHSNYLRFCEEARVSWCKRKGLLLRQGSKTDAVFGLAVYEYRLRHVKPVRYGDVFNVQMQMKIEGVRIIFQYKISVKDEVVALAETVHCNLDENYRVKRLGPELTKLAENELWIETWL